MVKKLLFASLVGITAITFTTYSFAQNLLLAYDGAIHKYTGNILSLKINGEDVKSDVPPIVIDNRSLVPVRGVFEKFGAEVKWDGAGKKVSVGLNDLSVELKINDENAVVNSEPVKMDVPAKIINNRTMVPLRFVSEHLNMKVGWFPDQGLITVDRDTAKPTENTGTELENAVTQFSVLNEIKHQKNGKQEDVILSLDSYKKHNAFKVDNPDRVVIDFPGTTLALSQKVNVQSDIIKAIRYAQHDEKTVRVVLDMVSHNEYTAEVDQNKVIMHFKGIDSIEKEPADGGGTGEAGTVGKKEDELSSRGDEIREPLPQENSDTKKWDVKYEAAEGTEKVTVFIDSYKDYKLMRLTGPDRLVLDIPGVGPQINGSKLEMNGKLLKTIRYDKHEDSTLRLVLDVSGQADYEVKEEAGYLVLSLANPSYKNILYHNNGDRVYFTLAGAKLTEGGEYLKRLYTGKFEEDGKKYIITFPSNLADLGSGKMKIYDGLLEYIEVIRDEQNSKTSIVFSAQEKLFFEIITRPDVNNTAITVFKPYSKEDRLVVIDPGHGGYESGAVYGDLYEKNLNLDISLRLNELLKKKNVKTYMIRQDDSFVGLYERAYIANNLNASLFLSIHNNAYYTSFLGTETLYFPQDPNDKNFNSKRFATIIQDQLVDNLKTKDRGIVERPKLVVLKATTMPAALAEIAFMTNSTDRANLMKEEFRQKSAEALCDSILKALEEIK
ncbi:MAG: N-acetylmuramoyl-L-alanine amidase family protein [Clostridia bacterium]|nr:N-acetylmuramoyl-L-alanine amidase family protein [Clostridia bacterium]